MRRDAQKAVRDLRRTGRRHPTATVLLIVVAVVAGAALGRMLSSRGPDGRRSSSPSAPDQVDLRDEYRERPGQAPQLHDDVQEWVRP